MALHLLASIDAVRTSRCLAGLAKDDTLLLAGDGVYALHMVDLLTRLQAATTQVFVLSDDRERRLPDVTHALTELSYEQWVQLCIDCTPMVSWY